MSDKTSDALNGDAIARDLGKLIDKASLVGEPTDEQVERAAEGIKKRLAFASLRWGVEHLHHDAIPHIARAALTAAGVAPQAPSDAKTWQEAVRAERARQIEKGYDAAHDSAHGVKHLLDWAQEYARRGEPVKSAALIEAAREVSAALTAPPIDPEGLGIVNGWLVQYGEYEPEPLINLSTVKGWAVPLTLDVDTIAKALAEVEGMPAHWGGGDFLVAAHAVVSHLTEGNGS